MTLQQFSEQTVKEILNSRSNLEAKNVIKEAKKTLERSSISEQDINWFWNELKNNIKDHKIILKESQAAAALNDLVAYALATIQQISSESK